MKKKGGGRHGQKREGQRRGEKSVRKGKNGKKGTGHTNSKTIHSKDRQGNARKQEEREGRGNEPETQNQKEVERKRHEG